MKNYLDTRAINKMATFEVFCRKHFINVTIKVTSFVSMSYSLITIYIGK